MARSGDLVDGAVNDGARALWGDAPWLTACAARPRCLRRSSAPRPGRCNAVLAGVSVATVGNRLQRTTNEGLPTVARR